MRLLVAGTALLAAGVIATAVLVAGCGGNDSPASKAFGGLSDEDLAHLRDWATDTDGITDAALQVLVAFKDEDADAAQDAVDRLQDTARNAADETLQFESTELRETANDYVARYADFADVCQRFIDYWGNPYTPADAATEERLSSAMQRAANAIEQADRDLVARVADVMTDEQRAAYLDSIEQAKQERIDALTTED